MYKLNILSGLESANIKADKIQAIPVALSYWQSFKTSFFPPVLELWYDDQHQIFSPYTKWENRQFNHDELSKVVFCMLAWWLRAIISDPDKTCLLSLHWL